MLLCAGLFRLENTKLVERTSHIKHPNERISGLFLGEGCRRSHFETIIVQLFICGKEKHRSYHHQVLQILRVFNQHRLFNLIKQYSIQTADLKWAVWLIPPSSKVGVSPILCAFQKHLVFGVKNVF